LGAADNYKYIMKKLLLIGLISTTLFSCTKEEVDDRPDCEKNNTSTVKVINTTNDSYDIYLDDVYQVLLPPNTFHNITSQAGFHLVRYEQTNGYLFTPTIENYQGTAAQCGEMVVTN
jgi:hypothetical protein